MSIKRLKDKEIKQISAGRVDNTRFLAELMTAEGQFKGVVARKYHGPIKSV